MSRDIFVIALSQLCPPGLGFEIHNESCYENVVWVNNNNIEVPSKDVVMNKVKELEVSELMRTTRIKRNKLLSQTDKFMIVDYPITDEQRTAMREYRQILRDLPQNNTTTIPESPFEISTSI